MCTHIDYTPIKCGMQQYALLFLYLYIEQIPSYVDGISSAINILPCWLDVDDAESPATLAYGLDRSPRDMDRNIAVIS